MFWTRCCKIQQQSLQQKITHIAMLQLNQSQVAIHFCTFQAYLEKAKVNLRFPSLFFVEWKTINGKNSVGMVGRRRATNSLIDLNETLTFNTEMLYHRAQKQYLKKQSLFHLNLISNSRPDQVKLVGRVVIDLSQIANSNKYAQVTTNKLMYCSVDADISFSLRLARSIQSNLELNDLDRSSFSDLYSFTSPIRAVGKNKMEIKEGLVDRRMEEERRKSKYKLSEREEMGYNPRNSRKEVKTENILIEESQERSVPQSLPLTEKKPALNMLQEIKMQVKQAEEVRNVVDTGFQARIYQEKDILEKELNDHKNKIKKLEVDIKEAMKLFQQSEQNSEINRSKLTESEETINNLKANEAKLREFYQKEVEKTKEIGSRQLQLTKASFEADRKILLATIEELKFKAHDLESMQKVTQEHQLLQIKNSELLKQLKYYQDISVELEKMKAQNAKYSEEKQHFLEQLKRKDDEVLNLAQQNNEIKASNYNILAQFNETKLELDNKISECQAIKEQSMNAKHFLTVEPTKEALPSVSFLDPYQLENYQKLQEEHKKLTLQIQNLKKSILFPEEYKKTQKENMDLFVIIQKSQLQDIQISQLKQENATMREKMEQLVLEHEQLKTQRSGNQSKYNNELETEQFNLLKEEFMLVKEENQKYVENLQILKEEIKDLRQKLSSKSTQLETFELLKMQLLDAQRENLRLNSQLQNLKKAEIPAQSDGLINLKPVKCEVSQEKENIALQGHHETDPVLTNIQQEGTNNHHQVLNEASPAKYNSDHKSLGLIEEHNDHQHHDFNFEEHASPLTHDELNKMLQVKEVNRDEMQYLMDEIFKLKEEIEELKSAKCYKKSQSDLGQEQNNPPFNEIVQLKDSLKKMQQENESLKGEIQILKQHQSNLISQQQHKEKISASNEAFTEQLQQLQKQSQDHQKTIFDLECHLQQLQKRNQQLENQLKSPHDPFERQNNFIRQLQAKIANLEEQLKIKDDLLAEGERNIEQNYTIKYQLADLKDKFSEIKSALQEKEEVINYLEEAKEQLSKELQQVGEKEHSRFIIEPKEILIETPKNEVDYAFLQGENADLKNEIEALKKQLVSMNNNQIELRNLSEAAANQKLSAEREKEEHVKKFQEAITRVSQLQAQVNEFSFMINGLNLQLEKSKQEINCLNEEVNTKSLKNDEIALQVDDLRSKNEELNSKVKIIESQSAFIGAQPLPEPISNSNEIDSLKAKYAEKIDEVRQKDEKIVQISSQLEAARRKIEELTVENQQLLQRIQNEGKGEIPFVAVHEVGSAIEPAPVQYEKSIIPLYEREELQRIEKNLTDQQKKDQDSLKKQLEEVKKILEKEISQKNSYYNALEIANTKIIELQIQAMTLKEQIQKFTSLPIQSFNHMATPVKQQHQYRQADASAKSIREPSIMNQPRVKGEISELSAIINPPQKETNQSPQKNPFSKNIETRVDTNVINEEQADSIKKQLQILKEQLESQQKLHQQLREIHNISEKKYELLNNHYENCLEQLNNFKAENGGLATEKENLSNQLYFVKDAYMSLQNEHDALLAIQNKMTQETQDNVTREVASNRGEDNNIKVKSQQFAEQRRQYQQRLLTAVKNEEKLTHKIQHLEENILNLEKSLQDHIQLSQSNDKITEKLEQLNELQTIAAQFKQQIEQVKQEKQQFAFLQAENELLKKEVSQMLKIVDQHRNCSSQKSEWQAKLLNIEHMLSDNQNRYAGEKQQLENKLFALTEEKASLIAEKSAIQENIKQGSLIVENHEEVPAKEAQLHSEMQNLRNEKLDQMQRVAELEEKLNNEQQYRSKRQTELQEAVIVREQQVEQLKFMNTQLHQQLEEVKAVASQHQQYTKEMQYLQSKLEQQVTLTAQYEMLIHNLREQINDLSNKNDNSSELERIRTELSALQEEISQKIIVIEQQKQKIVQLEQEQQNNRTEIANLQDQSALNQQELAKNIEQSNKLRDQNKELFALKTKIQNELKAVNARYSELENAIKNMNKLTDARDKSLEALKNQSSKKEQQINDLNKKMKTKESDIIHLTKQLDTLRNRNQQNQSKIRQLSEKQRLMKQTMQIVEQQSIKIVQSLKSRYESQEIYYRQCLEKQKENNRLALAVVEIRQQLENKQRILTYEEERINQLSNEIEFLKKKGENEPEANSNIVTIEYEKYQKLMEKNQQLLSKNREYLEIISSRSTATLENEKLKRQVKQLLQKMTEYQQTSIENQRKLDEKVPELEKQLLAVNTLKNELSDKLDTLQKELQQAKQANMKTTHAYIENIIMEKDKQISSLKNGSKKVKDSEILESNDDNISILNEQILNLNRQILEKDNELNKLKTEIHVSKPLSASENVQFDEEKQKLINELHERERREEEYKESIRKLREQLKSGLASPKSNDLSPSKEGKHVQQINTISNQLHHLCEQIKQLSLKRSSPEQSDKLFHTLIQKYDQMQQQFGSLSNETSVIQQKAKFISKELQKIKSFIIKSQNRSFKEKTQLLALIKPCQNAASEMVNISQTLSDKQSQNFI